MKLHDSRTHDKVSMERLYAYCGITRQGFYQAKARLAKEQEIIEKLLRQVTAYRKKKDRRAGSRGLYYNLDIKSQFDIGITKFEQIIALAGYSLMPLRKRVITTKSCYSSRAYPNLTNGLIIRDINELVAGDLTYLTIGKLRRYLFCLTDVYSGRLVGHCLGKQMRAEEAHCALIMWIDLRGEPAIMDLCIHHTDGGRQYFSALYLNTLKSLNLKISVADNCLENGFAEQRNGLIRNHFLATLDIRSESHFNKSFDKMVYFYNYERKQKRLGWRSPVEFENQLSTMKTKPEWRLYDFG
ncbi:MAG: DDE-type integrase/transposase/recombinase [Bacteroidales bacterium]|nr:DDE-type integrase/transposase/recombinase [Bacteroidales bacterium]